MAIEKEELKQECSPEHLHMVQQDRNKTIKDKGEEGKKKGVNVERSTVRTKKSRQPKRQKSLNLVQSRQLLTTVRQEVPSSNFDKCHEETHANFNKNLKFSKKNNIRKIVQSLTITKNIFIYVSINHNDLPY